MQLLKQIPKDTLSYTTSLLILSTTCYLIEAMVSFFNPDMPATHWQFNNLSLEPHKSLLITLLKNIRGLMMNSYYSYLDFMRMMLILHVAVIIIQFSKKCLTKESSITLPETQKDQESLFKGNPFPVTHNFTRYLLKTLQCLFYLTISYYLGQLVIQSLDSSRSILVGAKNAPTQKEHLLQNQFNQRILEESQQEEHHLETRAELLQDDLLDHLPTIRKTRGAVTGVVSRDGKTVFQIHRIATRYFYEYVLSGMDISDPLAIKHYPVLDLRLQGEGQFTTLVLSSNSKTLFLVTRNYLYIYHISHIRSPPKELSKTEIPFSKNSYSKASVALYEEKDAIIIGNENLHIFNISDIKAPIHKSWHRLMMPTKSIALLPRREMILVGTTEGLRAFDLSDLQNPKMKTRILENEYVFSISVTSLESTAFIGVLTEARREKGDPFSYDPSLSTYIVDLENIESSMPYHRFLLIDQLKTCRGTSYEDEFTFFPDIKMTFDEKYLYWACDKDYGYVDIAKKKVSRFLTEKKISAIALAQDSKILLKMDIYETNFYALYQNTQKDDYGSLVWKPTSISRLKLNPSEKVFTFKNNRMVYIINSNSTLQIYNTSENSFSLTSTIELEVTKPLSIVPSKDGKRLYMKTDEKTIQIYDISNLRFLQKLEFSTAINDDFIVTPDDKIIYAIQKVGGQNITTIIFINISNPSSPLIEDLLIEGQKRTFPGSVKLVLLPDGDSLFVLTVSECIVLDVTTIMINKSTLPKLQQSCSGLDSMIFSPSPWSEYAIFPIINEKDPNQKILKVGFLRPDSPYFRFPLPYLAGNLPMEVSISSEGDFLVYVSTPEHLLEIKMSMINDYAKISRLMMLSLKQFSLTGDEKFMYAVVGDYLEILDMRSKYALTSFKEDFSLGASSKIELQLLERTGQSTWDPVYKNHKFLTTNFYKLSNSNNGNELLISYFTLPNWINFDKDNAQITIESRLPSHLGTYKIYTTGSFQLSSSSKLQSSLSFLNNSEDSDQFLSDLTNHGYLDEEGFLTTKFNAYKKLTLNNQFSQFERICFQRQFFFIPPPISSLLEIETQSPHYTTARIVLKPLEGTEIIPAHIIKRTYSSSRSILNQNQTDLTLDGTFLNINDALAEVIIDVKEPYTGGIVSIMINDNMNPPIETEISVSNSSFHINAKPIANSDQNLSVQSQVNKYSFVSGQSFSINLHPKTYLDVNERPLEYSSLSPELDWLEIRGLTLTGTPPKKLWPSKVNVTMNIANEFKSEKVTFTLNIGMSAVILMQYAILYFGYLFSAYKIYQNLPKFYNILAQKFYRYPKAYQISVNEEVTDVMIAPIGFFGKEFENADLLINHLKKHLTKELNNTAVSAFIGYFKDEQGHGFDKNKLVATIKQVLKNLTVEEKYSLKYFVQINDDQRDIIHQIILDYLILSELNLPSEKQTLNIFKKVKDQWIYFVEQEDPSRPYFKANKSKLNYTLQNIDSKTKQLKSLESTNSQKDVLLDMTQSSVRSRYLSNSHLFENATSPVEESLLDSNLSENQLKNVNIELLELALQAHAFQSHHLNAQKEQMTIISKERKVGSSCFYKIKALLRYHLQGLQFANKEDVGYGLKYVFKKNVLHFCGTPEASMEYETLVVQILNKREMIMREIYLFGTENKSQNRDHIEQVQEQL